MSFADGKPALRQSAKIQTNHNNLSTLPQHNQVQERIYQNMQWRQTLNLIERNIVFSKRKVLPGQRIYTTGKILENIYIISAGFFKIELVSSDGYASNAEVLLDGDWLGLDAISTGYHTCTATALEFGEVWVVNYDTLIRESPKNPELLLNLVSAIGKSLGRCREQMLSNMSLPAKRKVADFLVRWVMNLSEHGKRTDTFLVPLSRAEIGSFLGLRLETVCRALQNLASIGLISFEVKVPRHFKVPNLEELKIFAGDKQESLTNQPTKEIGRRLHAISLV